MPATKRLAGMARSYGCPAITSDLASIVCLPSRMAITITNHLAACCLSEMASCFINDLAVVNQRLMSPSFGDLAEWLCKANQRLMSPYFGDLAEWLCKAFRVPGQKRIG